MRVTDTVLPGIGRLHVLGTSAGRCVGVIRHHSDRRELIVYDATADAVGTSVLLTPEEAHGLGELLGAGGIAGHIARLDHHASGIVTLQVLIGADVPAYDLADAGRHAPGHAAVVAVVRAGQLIADPAAAGPGRAATATSWSLWAPCRTRSRLWMPCTAVGADFGCRRLDRRGPFESGGASRKTSKVFGFSGGQGSTMALTRITIEARRGQAFGARNEVSKHFRKLLTSRLRGMTLSPSTDRNSVEPG